MKSEKVFFNAFKSVWAASGVSRKARGVEKSLSSGDCTGREFGDNTGGSGNCFFQRREMVVGKGHPVWPRLSRTERNLRRHNQSWNAALPALALTL